MPLLSPLDGVMYYKDCPNHARTTLQQLSQYQEAHLIWVYGSYFTQTGENHAETYMLLGQLTHIDERWPHTQEGSPRLLPHSPGGGHLPESLSPRSVERSNCCTARKQSESRERQIERILLQCPQFLRFYFSAKLAFLCSLNTPFKQFLVLCS